MSSDDVHNNDLSPYELARLERIRRNEERLRSLGLFENGGKSSFFSTTQTHHLSKVSSAKGKCEKSSRPKRKQIYSVPTRSSRRLKEAKERKDGQEYATSQGESNVERDAITSEDGTPEPTNDNSDQEKEVKYDCMPKEPEDLDDEEFQVYVSLRAWRLLRKNELEVEPYKICQNRTLCELIRKRRNDAQFCSLKLDHNANKAEGNVASVDESTVEKSLLSVWGIGPSKAAKDGFGWEMLEILASEENETLLASSRNRTNAANI
mmetsp:Transcript_25200/g.53132  ORF Transcript_25200/g.53132 Transcript_25200/m.53132 type:complete len:264 (+) Transcript_25200:65-856(+)